MLEILKSKIGGFFQKVPKKSSWTLWTQLFRGYGKYYGKFKGTTWAPVPVSFKNCGKSIFLLHSAMTFERVTQRTTTTISIHLHHPKGNKMGEGQVFLSALGQKCKNCDDGPYVPAAFTDDSIDTALRKLLLKAVFYF